MLIELNIYDKKIKTRLSSYEKVMRGGNIDPIEGTLVPKCPICHDGIKGLNICNTAIKDEAKLVQTGVIQDARLFNS